jgi:hypothetical protein
VGCQQCGARKLFHSLHPSLKYMSFCFPSPFIWQAGSVRESENMVRDTTTRFERAARELEDLTVRGTLSPPFL